MSENYAVIDGKKYLLVPVGVETPTCGNPGCDLPCHDAGSWSLSTHYDLPHLSEPPGFKNKLEF